MKSLFLGPYAMHQKLIKTVFRWPWHLKKCPHISSSLCESYEQLKKCFKKDYLVNNSRAVNILLFCETALVQKDRKYVGVTICTKIYAQCTYK